MREVDHEMSDTWLIYSRGLKGYSDDMGQVHECIF